LYKNHHDRRGEANCLKSLGHLQMRVNDLDSSRRSYKAALSIYREIHDRLGEANCLQSLGDLQMRVSDLDGARLSYETALPIFREIHARLGEANCLKSLALLALAEGRTGDAFSEFLGVLEIHREIQNGVGEQAALGYLARTAGAAGEAEQALLLAEASLNLGRRIQDRFGQTINLQLQLSIWAEREDFLALTATLSLLADLEQQIGSPNAPKSAELRSTLLDELPEDARAAILADPEAVRRRLIGEVEARFEAEGRDIFVLSPSD
jgi:tetratricopeptide (TPR) repeat protein